MGDLGYAPPPGFIREVLQGLGAGRANNTAFSFPKPVLQAACMASVVGCLTPEDVLLVDAAVRTCVLCRLV